MIHLEPGADAAGVEASVARVPDAVAEVRRASLGRHLPGSMGGGEYTWDVLLDGADAGRLLASAPVAELADRGARLDAVAFAPWHGAVPEPGIGACVKRTLLLRIEDGTPSAELELFERDLVGMVEHIGAIRNWALSRVDPRLHASRWTHVWEQEYRDVSGLEVDYMMSPYHWGLVDAWFDPEMPQRIVDRELAHVYCEVDASILAWK